MNLTSKSKINHIFGDLFFQTHTIYIIIDLNLLLKTIIYERGQFNINI